MRQVRVSDAAGPPDADLHARVQHDAVSKYRKRSERQAGVKIAVLRRIKLPKAKR